MIPHILHIKNFLSYGPETQIVDFRPYSLISLSGKNGHGKSALLDAITWAIWGQARKSSGQSKPDAGLMHLGQKHMMVILEFEVNGRMYRVRREYLQAQAKPFATLDFGIQNEDGKMVALTDKTIKDTQEKIERTIGITYDSFANSTFLRQGQSNEFSKKSPKERKEILAQILQLQRFEAQKKIAVAHARKLQTEYQTKLQIQQRIAQELLDLATVADQYLSVQQLLEDIEQRLGLTTHQLGVNKQQQQEIAIKISEISFLQRHLDELQTKHTALQQEITQIQQQLDQGTTLLSQEDLIAQEHKALERVQLLEKHQTDRNQLKERYFATKEQLNTLISKIEQEYRQQRQLIITQQTQQEEALKQTIKQKRQEQINLTALEQSINTLQAQEQQFLKKLAEFDQIKANYEHAKQSYDQQRQEYQQVCAQGTYVKQYAQKIEHDQKTLMTSDDQLCVLCTQSLNSQQQEIVHDKLHRQHAQLQQELASLKTRAHELKSTMPQHLAQVHQYQKDYEEGLQVQAKFDQHRQQQEALQVQHVAQLQRMYKLNHEELSITDDLETTKITLQSLDKAYQDQLENPEVQEKTKLLHEIEQKAQELTASLQHYQAAQQELVDVRKLLAQAQAHNSSTQQHARLQQLLILSTQMYTEITTLHEKIALGRNLQAQMSSLAQEHEIHVTAEKKLHQEQQQALVIKGSLEQKQKKQSDLEQEMTAIVAQAKSLHQEMIDYQEIAKALGKDGIQALLIEQAIPEIEHETNQILARLTNNQTQIFIESLRDLKKGGSKETLDIKIADPFGLRDYEMFSGGEAFRIDFALRIGISKLLARRAGTTLQTIFIDEGFGSQDDEGLGLIMDNIHKIQEDFAKIIIVSHLQELKEQFPVQFVVEKKRSGSSISIVHLG